MELAKDISYSLDSYDSDGDMYERGVYFHFGEARVRVCESPKELPVLEDRIAALISEIKETLDETNK